MLLPEQYFTKMMPICPSQIGSLFFLPTAPDMAVVSSSTAKEIAKFERDIKKFVPNYVADQIKKKYGFVKLSG